MHILVGKRQILLSALVVVLGLAVFVNWYFTGTDKPLSPEGAAPEKSASGEDVGNIELVNAPDSDYFASVRLERSTSRDKSLEELKAVMEQASADSDAAVKVNAMIDAISTAAQRESDIEAMVSASLGGECVTVISGDSVDVVINRGELNDESALKISDIVNSVCGKDYENIRICAATD